jgi:hypothetical protein
MLARKDKCYRENALKLQCIPRVSDCSEHLCRHHFLQSGQLSLNQVCLLARIANRATPITVLISAQCEARKISTYRLLWLQFCLT